METLKMILVLFVAIEHLYILWLEMFAWETQGKKAFRGSLPKEMFKPTKTLAEIKGFIKAFWRLGSSGSCSLKTIIGNSTWLSFFFAV